MISGISGGVLAVLIGFIAIYKIRKRRKTQNRLRLINSLRIDNTNSVSSQRPFYTQRHSINVVIPEKICPLASDRLPEPTEIR